MNVSFGRLTLPGGALYLLLLLRLILIMRSGIVFSPRSPVSTRSRWFLSLLFAGALLAGAVPARSGGIPAGTVERRLGVMGTWLAVEVEAADRPTALAGSEGAVREIERIEALFSTWRSGTPLDQVNHAAVGNPVPVPAELAALLARLFELSEATSGAFDPAVGPLIRAWDLRGNGRRPGAEELRAAIRSSAVGSFRIDERGGRVTRLDPSAAIDEGAWGKGYALDRASARLAESGAASALLDLGGQVLSVGDEARTVDLSHPVDRLRPVATIALRNASLSVSGDSERFRVVGGERIGHLLDPRTGLPARDFGSVAVVSPSALVADVLSTALFVAGPEEGIVLSERLRASGIPHEALFLIVTPDGLAIRASAGFPPIVRSLDLAVFAPGGAAQLLAGTAETVPEPNSCPGSSPDGESPHAEPR